MSILIRTLYLAVLLLCGTVFSANASSLGSRIAQDFAPTSGYLIQTSARDYLIDPGSGQKIAVGDLFSLIGPGEAITHPVTGKVLGTQERLKGILRLTRLKENYAHSQPVGQLDSPKRGDVIRRYQDMQALFWDYTGQGEALAIELQAALPGLQWQAYATAQRLRPASPTAANGATTTLYFILTATALEVRAPDFELIHSYPTSTTALSNQPVQSQSAPPALTVLPPVTGGAIQAGGEPLWNYSSIKGVPIGVEAGDFNGDGIQEIAIAFEDRVEIGRLTAEGYQMMGTIRLAAGSRAYALDAADLLKSGRPQLYLSAMNSNGNPAGIATEFSNGRFRTSITKIPWHLRRVELPGEGTILVGQEYDSRGREFAGPVFRVKRSGNQLAKGAQLTLPKRVNIYGFTAFSDQGRTLYACIDDDGYLVIQSAKGEPLATSADTVGGTESSFEMTDEVPSGGEARRVYLKGRVELTPQGNILVSANSGVSLLGRLKMYLKSELKLFRWNGNDLREVWHTAPDKSYLADFKLLNSKDDSGAKLVTTVAFPSMNPLAERKAALRLYELGSY